MSTELLTVLAILGVMLTLMISNRLRLDLIALVALLALFFAGVIDVGEALAGFSEPVVLMIAGLFVVGAGLFRTGVAAWIGRRMESVAGESPRRLIAVIMLVTALLSAFLSSTGTVAVMLPVVLAIARDRGISPSLLLIPVAFAALLGGMMTLIGTPPNLIVSSQLAAAGMDPFGFFDFTPAGVVMLTIGMAFMVWVGPWLIPERRAAAAPDRTPSWQEMLADYGIDRHVAHLRLPRGCALANQQLTTTDLRSSHGVTVMVIRSRTAAGRVARKAEPGSVLSANDEVYVTGTDECIDRAIKRFGLERLTSEPELPQKLVLVDALVPPRSSFIGKTLRDLRLHSGAGVLVLAHRPAGKDSIPPDLDLPLAAGDALLMTGREQSLRRLSRSARDLVMIGGDGLEEKPRLTLAPVAVAVMLAMMLVMTFELVPNVIAVLAAALTLVLTRCLTMNEAYQAVNWESVVLIAAVLPMATALDNTGGIALASQALLAIAGDLGPLALMAALFIFTSVLSQIISNTATTVLVAPIGLSAGLAMGIDPHALMMTVAIAASTAFATPVASPVNTLVLNPGGYRFTDFARVGIPLQVLLLIATLIVVPLIFPF